MNKSINTNKNTKHIDQAGAAFLRVKKGSACIPALTGILIVLFTSCTVGPNYRPPENDVASQWHDQSSSSANQNFSDSAPAEKWWKNFGDYLLDKYIALAFQYNKDILTAQDNILQARALRQTAASSLFPQIDAQADGARTGFSKNGRLLSYSLPGFPTAQNLFNALFDASWEIDIFGKTRRQTEAAAARIGGAIETKNDILVSIAGEVAKNYLEVRNYQEQEALIRKDIQLLEENLAVVRQSVLDGYKDRLDLENIKAELYLAKSRLPAAIAGAYRGIYALSFLVGQVPEALFEEMIRPRALPQMPYAKIAIGLRSDLLRRRPDVRKAERELAAATAEVGAAVASFFPTFTLSADLGLQAVKIVNLFKAASKTWEAGGSMKAPIFEGGRLVGNWQAKKALASAAMHAYQNTVLNALQQTQSALVSYQEDLNALKNVKDKAYSNQVLAALNAQRYKQGLVNILALIDAERKLVFAEETVLKNKVQALLDLVVLYKALGGGWQNEKKSS